MKNILKMFMKFPIYLKKNKKSKNHNIFEKFMNHPVYEINKERLVPLKKSSFHLKFTKKSLYNLSKPKNFDYMKEGYS